jgi:hypothetical protein
MHHNVIEHGDYRDCQLGSNKAARAMKKGPWQFGDQSSYTFNQCYIACRDHKYFGLQYQGQCFCSDSASETFGQGASTAHGGDCALNGQCYCINKVYEYRSTSTTQCTAPLKSATIQPPYSGGAYPGSNCIDGRLDTFCHSNTASGAYFRAEVDAAAKGGKRLPISRVVLYNRHDCCGDRFASFNTVIGESASPYGSVNGVVNKIFNGGYMTNSAGGTATEGNSQYKAGGKYVFVAQTGSSRILNMGEFKAYYWC